MEHRTFDDIARWLSGGATRRVALGLAAALGISGVAHHDDSLAAKNKKHSKKRFCLNGKTVKAKNKKKKRRLRRQGATRGRCTGSCTPTCPTDNTCGMDDGCGAICGCASGSVCAEGVCTTCTVTCGSDAATCGEDLQNALTAGGDVYVCPGLYSRAAGFVAPPVTSIYGAGSGTDQASDTILDVDGATVTVLNLPRNLPATLSGVRITGGNFAGADAGGLSSAGAALLTIDNCAIVGNTGGIGGVYNYGPANIVNSLISGNTGTTDAGGVLLELSLASMACNVTNSVIDGNEGATFGGIGIVSSATSIVTVDSTTQITNNQFTGGSGDRAGGIGQPDLSTAVVTVNGATVTGNSTPQCLNVTGCS